jgi:hypothetical protein
LKSKINPAFLFAFVALLLLLAYVFSPETDQGVIEASPAAESGMDGAVPVDAESGDAESSSERSEISAKPEASITASADETMVDEKAPLALHGTILDEQGNGIAGAWIVTWQEAEPVYSDAQGNFTLPLAKKIGRGHWGVIVAWAEDYELGLLQVSDMNQAMVTLKKVPPFQVRIVSTEGQKNIAGATAKVMIRGTGERNAKGVNQYKWVETPIPAMTSDEQGLISIPGITSAFLHVSAPGYADREAIVYSTPHETKVYLAPDQESNIRFVHADGTALASANISFDPSREVLSTDEEGWVAVPSLARTGYDSIALNWEEKGFVFAGYMKGPAPPALENGSEIVVPYREIHGQLVVNGKAKASDFEIATCALRWHVGDRAMPDPEDHPELLSWIPVGEDGSIAIPTGWQGLTTRASIRRIADQKIMLEQILKGDGPYEFVLNLDQGGLARFRIQADPPEVLDSMSVWLQPKRVPGQGEESLAFKVQDGVAEGRLLPGLWSARMMIEGSEVYPKLSQFVMPEGDFELDFNLGKMRKVSGTLTAAGKPIADAWLEFYQPDGHYTDRRTRYQRRKDDSPTTGFQVRKKISADGSWALGWIPDARMEAMIETDNRWLGRDTTFHFDLPPGQEFFDLQLPVATLRLDFVGDHAPLPKDVQIWHSESEEFGGRGVIHQSVYHTSFPDLSKGPAELAVSPGRYKLFLDDPTQLLTPSEFTIQQGEAKSLTVSVAEAGEVVTVWESEEGVWAGEITLEELSEAPSVGNSRRLIAREYNGRKGGFRDAYSVRPGKWKFALAGPVERLTDKDFSRTGESFGEGNGPWTIDLDVAPGKRTFVLVGVDSNGQITLRAETRDRRK